MRNFLLGLTAGLILSGAVYAQVESNDDPFGVIPGSTQQRLQNIEKQQRMDRYNRETNQWNRKPC